MRHCKTIVWIVAHAFICGFVCNRTDYIRATAIANVDDSGVVGSANSTTSYVSHVEGTNYRSFIIPFDFLL